MEDFLKDGTERNLRRKEFIIETIRKSSKEKKDMDMAHWFYNAKNVKTVWGGYFGIL